MRKKTKERFTVLTGGKFFRITFISYIFLCITLIALSFILSYFFLYKQLKKEIFHSQDMVVSIFKENVISQFKNLDEIALIIKRDPEMLSALTNDDYGYYKNGNKLLGYLSINDNLSDIFIYDSGVDRICSATGGVSVEDYFGTYFKFENFPSNDIAKFLNGINQKTMTPMFLLNSYKNRGLKENATLYIVPISYSRKVVFVLKESFFTKNLDKHFTNNQVKLAIFNSRKKEILTIGNITHINYELLDDFIAGRNQTITQQTGDSYVSLISGLYNDWYYYLEYAINDYTTTIHFINTIINASLIFEVLLGVFLSFVASQINYKPIRNLYCNVMNVEHMQYRENELGVIENYLQTVTARNIEMSQKLDREYSLLRCNMINSVMNGNISYSDNINIFKNSCYELKYKWFCVVVFNIQGEASPCPHVNKIIFEIAENEREDELIMPIMNLDGNIVSIVINAPDHDKLKEIAIGFCTKILSESSQDIVFGVGTRYDSTDSLSASYSKALIAMTAAHTQSPINHYTQLNSPFKSHFQAISECKQRITRMVKELDLDSIIDYVGTILSNQSSADLQMIYYANIISTLLILCEQYDLPVSNLDDYLLTPRISSDQLPKKAIMLATKLCHHIPLIVTRAEQPLINNIVHFIIGNISLPNLTSQMVANQFGVSLSYLNQYFKSQMDLSPTAYIDKKRISMAADLVINSDMQIKDIVSYVGYIDVNNFIRKFKKIYGMPPLQYRHQYSQQK